MRCEAALLIECCRATVDSRQLHAQFAQRPDWTSVYQLATWHGVRPLLLAALEQHGAGQVPADVLSRLRADTRVNAAHNLTLTSELFRILDRLHECGVPAVALKGPALAVSAYGELSMREFEDLDILIPKTSVRQAECALRGLGYLPEVELRDGSTAFIDCNHQLAFTNEVTQCRVELHWSLQETKFLGRELNLDGWWRRLASVGVCGRQIPVPVTPDLLLFLCLHGAKHYWQRLKWVCDIAALSRTQPAESWVEALRLADSLGLRRVYLLGLALAFEVAGAVFPNSVRDALVAEPGLNTLTTAIRTRFDADPSEHTSLLGRGFFHLQLCDNDRERLLYCCRNLFVPTAGEWGLFKLPAKLEFLYSPLRPFRLLSVHGLESARRVLELASRPKD